MSRADTTFSTETDLEWDITWQFSRDYNPPIWHCAYWENQGLFRTYIAIAIPINNTSTAADWRLFLEREFFENVADNLE